MNRNTVTGAVAAIGIALAFPSVAFADFVTNGGFEMTSQSGSAVLYPGDTSITGWTNNATYTLLIFPGDGDKTSSGLGGFALWGPNTGVANGLPATSPAGGNYVGLDSDSSFRGTGLQQTISGLTPGSTYTLSFYFAAGQEVNASDDTTEQIQATLGSETVSTEILNTPYQGFSPWHLETFTLTATDTTELLTLLAVGGPGGAPPIALIDGVSLAGGPTPVPEPASWTLVIAAVAGLVGFRLMRGRTRA